MIKRKATDFCLAVAQLILPAVLTLAMPLPLFAHTSRSVLPPTFRALPVPGLPDRGVTALAVGLHGDLWAGTLRGLARFDGQRWYTFDIARAIGAPWITALLVDRQGRVWAGTQGEGLYRRDEQGWQKIVLPLPSATRDWIVSLTADEKGRLLVSTLGSGEARFDGKTWTRYPLAHRQAGKPGDEGTTGAPVRSFAYSITSQISTSDGTRWIGTTHGLARLRDGEVSWVTVGDGMEQLYISALAVGGGGGGGGDVLWIGTLGHGLFRQGGTPLHLTNTTHWPVILIHGWHGPSSDLLADSQLAFLARWLRADGYPVFYATGIRADQTLGENADTLRQAILRARRATGADRVHLIGHSMGGLVARAYVESNRYAGDVASVVMLGTPNGGLRLWYGQLALRLRWGNAEPSLVELTPGFMAAFNADHRPRDCVPYLLLAGDLTGRVDVLRGWPANDGLIEQGSVFAVKGVQVSTEDAHGWTDDTILYEVPAYTWPRRTYDRYIHPWLSDQDSGSAGKPERETHIPSVLRSLTGAPGSASQPMPHTPYVTREITAGTTLTLPLVLGPAKVVRFFLTWKRGDLRFRLVAPNGQAYDGQPRNDMPNVAYLHMDDTEIVPFAVYRVERPARGRWLLVVENRGTNRTKATMYAVPEDGQELILSTIRVQTVPAKGTGFERKGVYAWGEPVALRVAWTVADMPVRGGTVVAEVPGVGRQYHTLSLVDDGKHEDGAANDGVYGTQFVPVRAGYQAAFIQARRGAGNARAQEVIYAVRR